MIFIDLKLPSIVIIFSSLKYIPIKFIRNFLMGGFIDLTNIDTIKSLPKDIIIDDNWMELNYLYNRSLVEGLDMVEILSSYINIENFNIVSVS